MNKKGDVFSEFSFKLFWILVPIGVVLTLFFVVYQLSDDTYYKKSFVSTDLALLVSTVSSSPYNLQINYDTQEVYNIREINEDGIKYLLIQLNDEDLGKRFPYVSNRFVIIDELNVIAANSLIIKKIGNEVVIEKNG